MAPLRELLGAKLVAYLGPVSETRSVRQWAEGTRTIANPDDVGPRVLNAARPFAAVG